MVKTLFTIKQRGHSATSHPVGHVRIVSAGQYLHNFDSAWFTKFQDDPTCWTSDADKALWLSPSEAAAVCSNGQCGYQEANIEA